MKALRYAVLALVVLFGVIAPNQSCQPHPTLSYPAPAPLIDYGPDRPAPSVIGPLDYNGMIYLLGEAKKSHEYWLGKDGLDKWNTGWIKNYGSGIDLMQMLKDGEKP